MKGMPFIEGEFGTDKKGFHMKIKCPDCGTTVFCRELKDFESFSKSEFKNHTIRCKGVR